MKRALAVCACIASLAPLGGAQPRQLAPADRSVVAQLLRMGDTRTLDTAAFDLGLRSSARAVRGLALLTLGNLGAAEARPRVAALRQAVADPDAYVASRAAFALGLLRDTASVAALNDALQRDAVVAQEAAWSLGQIGEPARAAIVDALRRRDAWSAHVQLLLAASKLRPVPVEVLPPYLASDREAERWAAAYAISRPRVSAGLRMLLGAEKTTLPTVSAARDTIIWYLAPDASHRVAAEVARALTAGAVGDSLGDTAYAELLRLARHQHPHVRINALRSLATYARTGAADPIVAATRDDDANVRIAAAQALATMRQLARALGPGGAPVTELPRALIDADTAFTFRRALMEAALANRLTVPWLEEWQRNHDWRHRAAVASASAAAAPALRDRIQMSLVVDPEPRVRAATLAAITSDSALVAARRSTIYTLLGSRSARTRAAAVSALARLASASEVPLVLDAYDAADRDLDPDARIAAIAYVGAAWRRDSARFSPQTLARLRALRTPAHVATRATGRSLPFFAHWRATRIRPRPMSWYERVARDVFERSLSRNAPRATITTAKGAIVIELLGTDAPLTVHNFASLARATYYDGVRFHRVVPNFVAQDGDPSGDGNGGPGYVIRDELNLRRYERGIVGMALSGPDTGGSQYFITHSPQPHLDGGYTVFGRVTSGLEALDQLVQGDRITSVTIR